MNKRLVIHLTLLVLLLTSAPFAAFSQVAVPSRATITAELEKRGIDAIEFERRMNQRGVSLDNIDPNNPAALQRIQRVAEEVMAEMSKDSTVGVDTTDEGTIMLKDTLPVLQKEEVLDEPEGEDKDADEIDEALEPVKTWGQQIFRNKQLEYYQTASSGSPPANYVLGNGDKLNVAIWGQSQENLLFEINEQGYIAPPQMSRIYLKGLTFQAGKELLKKRFQQYYRFRDQEFDVTLSAPRKVAVTIVGEVFKFGTFNMPARNTAFNALVASGGPTDIGSVRNIQIKRSGSSDKNLDVYQYLLDPSVQDQFFVQDNDVIFVPVAEKLVSISGAINRPLQYELVDGEGLKALISFAGGSKVNAYLESVQVIRTRNGRKQIINVNLTPGRDFLLENGDAVKVLELQQEYENFVSTSGGGFDVESDFELSSNMKVTDLLNKAGLRRDAALDVAFLERVNLDSTIYYEKIQITQNGSAYTSSPNLDLLPQDKLIIYQQRAFATNKTIEVKGAVRNPGEFNFDISEKLRVGDILMLAGGTQDEADNKGYILRSDLNNAKNKSYLTFNIIDALSGGQGDANPLLQPNDVITIFKSERYADDLTVTVEGAVRAPGTFAFGKDLTLEDAINLAGGMKIEASAIKVEVVRINLDDTKSTETSVLTMTVDKSNAVLEKGNGGFVLMPFDNIIVREVPDFELQEFINISGEVKYPGKYALIRENEPLTSIIQRAGGLTNSAFPEGATMYRNMAPEDGYVILDLDRALANPTSKFNQVVKRGDLIDIPKTRGLVTIETTNTNAAELYGDEFGNLDKFSVSFQPGKGVKYYLDEYVAGVNQTKGLRRKVTVRQANGRLDRTKKVLFTINSYPKVEEGSTIIVGDKPTKEQKFQDPNREQVDWGKVAVDTLSIVTSAVSLILLVDRLK